MKLIPCSWRTTDMIIKTYYSIPYTHINKVVYELPRHEEVNKFTKMSLVFKNGIWNVVADVYPTQKQGRELISCESKENSYSFPSDKHHI